MSGAEATTEKMFGPRGGILHPYFSMQGEWTDNLYNINIDEQESFSTVTAAGLWYSIPRRDEVPVRFSINNSAVGGTRFSLDTGEDFERFQAYLFGGADYTTYSNFSDLDYTSWRLEGLYQQNFPAGFSIRVLDRFSGDRDYYDIGSFLPRDFTNQDGTTVVSSTPSLLREYISNLASLAVLVEITKNLTGRFEYSNFLLDYDETENNWLDRTDDRYTGSLAWDFSPKTRFFFEYNLVQLSYDTDTAANGSSDFYYAGIRWKGSEKSSLTARAGFQERLFDDGRSLSGFATEMQMNYAVTEKTRLSFELYKAIEESNSFVNSGMDTIAAAFHYRQQFSYRFLGRMDFLYEKNDYERFTRESFNDSIAGREDMRFSFRPALEYTLRDWIMFDLAYLFENRDSNDNQYDFTTQTLSLSMNVAF
ncbi:MAG: hypothetical protein Kow0089_23730 [Desulfobulbaceae bacterium]